MSDVVLLSSDVVSIPTEAASALIDEWNKGTDLFRTSLLTRLVKGDKIEVDTDVFRPGKDQQTICSQRSISKGELS